MLVASINFWGNRHKLWEGGRRYSKFLPTYNLRARGMLLNCFIDIWYAVRWSYQPLEQPDSMPSEWYCWMLINDFIADNNKYRKRTFVPDGYVEVNKTVIQWYGIGGAYVNTGLPMYLALECKPNNGGKIPNLADIASGIML
jgi:hypothetical protein